MNARRTLALLLVLIPLGTLAFMSRTLAFPLILALIALVGATGRLQWPLWRRHEAILVGLIGLVFSLKWMLLPSLRIGDAPLPFFSIGIIDYSLGYHLAQGLLTCEVAFFFVKRGARERPTMPLRCAIALVMAGTIPAPIGGGTRDAVFQAASLLFTVVAGLYFSVATRRPRVAPGRPALRAPGKWAVLCTVLVLVVALGWALGRGLYTYGDKADRLFGGLLANRQLANTVGFSTDGRFGKLGNTKRLGGNAVSLRVFSEDAPGYLRGKVFDTFETTRWSCIAEPETAGPVEADDLPEAPPGSNWFALGESRERTDQSDPTDRSDPSGASDLSDTMEIYRAAPLKHALFTPLNAACLCAPAQRLSLDIHRVALGEQMQPGTPYQVAGLASRHRELGTDDRAWLTVLPQDLDPRIRELAASITSGCSTELEKTAAITQYLTSHYDYDLGAGPAEAKEPVSAFLFDVRKGHCEFFASSAAVLLRSAGVPCRYVTGFVADEQNAFGGYWVARNKDAHAWVEAHIDGHGWKVVEATPASGVPMGHSLYVSQLWDYLRYLPKAALAAMRELGLKAYLQHLLRRIGRNLWGTSGILIALAAGCSVVMWVVVRRRRKRAGKIREHDPLVIAMQRLLRQMDARLERDQLVRAPSETLHRFAARVEGAGKEDAAGWYRAYASLRYGAKPDERAVEKLAHSAQP